METKLLQTLDEIKTTFENLDKSIAKYASKKLEGTNQRKPKKINYSYTQGIFTFTIVAIWKGTNGLIICQYENNGEEDGAEIYFNMFDTCHQVEILKQL